MLSTSHLQFSATSSRQKIWNGKGPVDTVEKAYPDVVDAQGGIVLSGQDAKQALKAIPGRDFRMGSDDQRRTIEDYFEGRRKLSQQIEDGDLFLRR